MTLVLLPLLVLAADDAKDAAPTPIAPAALARTGPEEKTRTKVVLNLPPAGVTPVLAVAISPDGSTVAAGRGNRVHLFDAKTGAFRKTLTDPELKTSDGKPAAAAHLSLVESMAY